MSDWSVIFILFFVVALIYDFGWDAGIHSLPMDKDGQILGLTLGAPA